MWINKTFAVAASLVASAINNITEGPLSVSTSVPDIYEQEKRDLSPNVLSLTKKPDFDLQTGLDWNLDQLVSDAIWNKSVDKGNHFECLMRASEDGVQNLIAGDTPAKSPWIGTLQDELKKWNWHEGYVETDIECDFKRLHLQEVFDGLGLDPRPGLDEADEPTDGSNICHKLHHFDEELKNEDDEELDVLKQPYVLDGTTRYATGAYYNFGINSGGAIIGMDLVGPKYAVTERDNWNREADSAELPSLRYMSDIFWAFYLRGNPNPKNLRYYIATHVLNDVTVALAARALRNAGVKDLSEWPGNSFELGSEALAALVGSPIGGSIAALLFQHKADLGLKHITKVTVVYDSNSDVDRKGNRLRPWLYTIYHIEDVPPDEDEKSVGGSMAFEGMNMDVYPRGMANHSIRVHTII